MDNHVHLIAVPKKQDSLSKGIGETHRRYTTIINIRENWGGYLWQGRFNSFPLDERHLFLAARYIELNPVRAGIVKKPEDYYWSSAKSHVMKAGDKLLSDHDPIAEFKDWKGFLQRVEGEDDLLLIRKHIRTGRPLGNEDFINKLERISGRILWPQRPGRKPA